jgi:preprotein translocase subunit SecD
MKPFIALIAVIVFISCSAQKQKDEPPYVVHQNNGNTLMTGWYNVVDSSAFKRKVDREETWYYIDPTPIVTAENISDLIVDVDQYGRPSLFVRLNENVFAIWEEATGKLAAQRGSLAFILNDKLLFAPLVNSAIPKGASAISPGNYSVEELNKIKQEIEKEIPR